MGSERRKCFALMGLTAPTNQSIDNCPIPSLETCNKIRRRLFLFFQMLESLFPPSIELYLILKGCEGLWLITPEIETIRTTCWLATVSSFHSEGKQKQFIWPRGACARTGSLMVRCALCSGIIHLDIFLRIIITRQFLFHMYLNATLNVLELSYNRNL